MILLCAVQFVPQAEHGVGETSRGFLPVLTPSPALNWFVYNGTSLYWWGAGAGHARAAELSFPSEGKKGPV